MEFLHLVLHLGRVLKAFIEVNDRLFQKSLKRTIPDLTKLLKDPHIALDHREITIGPARKYFSALLVGIILAWVGFLAIVVFLLLLEENRPSMDQSTIPPCWMFGRGSCYFRSSLSKFPWWGLHFETRRRGIQIPKSSSSLFMVYLSRLGEPSVSGREQPLITANFSACHRPHREN
jgi:hypothetical protein